MSEKSSPLSDSELFRQSVGRVQPLVGDKIAPYRVARSPHPRPREDVEEAVAIMPDRDSLWLEGQRGEYLEFYRPGIQRRTLKRLRRGYYRIERQLDLHGKTVRVAQQKLQGFLRTCQRPNQCCVRIIHGKGLSSLSGQSVLKHNVSVWLREHPCVLAFCSAPDADGGSGALYVLIRAADGPKHDEKR